MPGALGRGESGDSECPEFWLSIEHSRQDDAVVGRIPEPAVASVDWSPDVSRRSFLTWMGASVALGGLEGCTKQPLEEIVPYVNAPEELIPGKPLHFATAMTLEGEALGVVVRSEMGRPSKVEGNPQHPTSLGATNAFMQASVMTLYDPDRSRVVLEQGTISTFDAMTADILAALGRLASSRGRGLRFLTGPVSSPTLLSQIEAVMTRFPEARWHYYSPVNREAAVSAARQAFGKPVEPVYRFDRAVVILSLDADFLSPVTPGHLRYAHDFMAARRMRANVKAMNRLYVVEGAPTLAGVVADHRLALAPSRIESVARGIAAGLGLSVERPSSYGTANLQAWIDGVVQDLRAHAGRCLVLPGHGQPEDVHLLVHAMNAALGNLGQTVEFIAPAVAAQESQTASLRALARDMQSGRVEVLFCLHSNPIYTAPADIEFGQGMGQVPATVHLGLYVDETASRCRWHIPATHYLEDWSDARAFNGLVTIQQPLIAPLYQGRSVHELLELVAGGVGLSAHQIVRNYWATRMPPEDFEKRWTQALHDGFVAGTASVPMPVQLRSSYSARRRIRGDVTPPAMEAVPATVTQEADPGRLPSDSVPRTPATSDLEIIFAPDPSIWDGTFSNNAWLQELPRPLTKLTWDNAAHLSPGTARRLALRQGDVVALQYRGRSVKAPVWVMPGHPDDAVTVHLGYGRTGLKIAAGAGFNAYALRTSDAPWFGGGLELRKTGETYPLANTQEHFRMEGRDLVRVGTLETFIEHPGFPNAGPPERPLPSLLPEYPWGPYEWGMVIDLTTCIGCASCVVACQAENNIPAVGKRQVEMHREMHWLRIDRYYRGELEDPELYFQPVLCMHCEKAPCELVCPVEATLHDTQGLNQMIYNRCIGTRYCSNNCPYKVRRFNFLEYDSRLPSLALQRNPDVTVRSRGVMEKCTYCIQRINAALIDAGREDRMVREGEVQTACQQACPTGAITFGNLSDPGSAVSKLRQQPHNYALLAELNTRPRTTYLARITNPNPAIRRS